MDWRSWATDGVTEEVPRTMGPECENYLPNTRRWIEAVLFSILFIFIIKWTAKRIEPIQIPKVKDEPFSNVRILLLVIMTFTFGIEMGFKFANRSVIFVLNPCHIQTLVQIYILASKPNKLTTTLFRIQMNNLNGPVLAFVFPEVECRTLPFEQATYWIQHAMLYIIPVYILKSSAYQVEDFHDCNWFALGVAIQLLYHFTILNGMSIYTGINLNHMLCAAQSDPFQGQHYREAAVIHESILCPILNKLTVYVFAKPESIQVYDKSKVNAFSKPINTGLQGESVDRRESKQHHQLYNQQHAYSEPTPTSASLASSAVPYDNQYTQQQQQHYASSAYCHPSTAAHHGDDSILVQRKVSRNLIETPAATQSQLAVSMSDSDDYILEQDDIEIVDAMTTTKTITAEYTMPTTKID